MRVSQYAVVVFLLSIKVKGDVVNGPVTLKEGDREAQLRNISKVKPGGRWTLEKNGSVVLRRCSPEEERRGCTNKTSPRFSVLTGNDTDLIVLYNVTESDDGLYVFQVAGDKEEPFNVTVAGCGGVKTTTRTETKSPNTSSPSKAPAICFTILAVVLLLLLVLLYFMCKNKEKIKNWCKGVTGNTLRHVCQVFRMLRNDDENPQNLLLRLLSDVNTSSPHDITVC